MCWSICPSGSTLHSSLSLSVPQDCVFLLPFPLVSGWVWPVGGISRGSHVGSLLPSSNLSFLPLYSLSLHGSSLFPLRQLLWGSSDTSFALPQARSGDGSPLLLIPEFTTVISCLKSAHTSVSISLGNLSLVKSSECAICFLLDPQGLGSHLRIRLSLGSHTELIVGTVPVSFSVYIF